MIAAGKLDKFGKPNENTPKDWLSGEAKVATNGSAAGTTDENSKRKLSVGSNLDVSMEVGESTEKKKKKKKIKLEQEEEKEEVEETPAVSCCLFSYCVLINFKFLLFSGANK